MKRKIITCMIVSMITGVMLPQTTATESNDTMTDTQNIQETTIERTIDSSLTGIDTMGFETEIYYINSSDDYDRCTTAILNRNGKIIIEVLQAVVTSDNGDAMVTVSGDYIKYNANDVKKGDHMETVLVYNPATNYDDDVMYRADTFLE